MAVNLLEMAKSYLSDGVVNQVSTMLGESEHDTQKAFDGALPAVLGGLIQKSREPGGNGSIMDMLGDVTAPDRTAGDITSPVGGIAGNLGSMLSDGLQSSRLLSMGSTIIQTLFGDKAGAITGALSSFSGIKQTSATSLMSLAGPLLLSVLGKRMADDGTGVSSLDGLLGNQATHVQSALPAGLTTLLGGVSGLSFLGGLGNTMGAVPSSVADPLAPTPVTPVRTAPPVTPTPETPIYTNEEDKRPAGGMNWLPWLLLLLGAVALFFLLRSCRTDGTNTLTGAADSVSTNMNDAATSVGAATDSMGQELGAAMDTMGNTVRDATSTLGVFIKRKLSSGIELNIPENGIENQLVTFIDDANKPVDKTTWFNFRRLLFDTGKASLKPDSKEEVKNIAEILKAYPAVEIKVGGYTDNTGSADLNKKLSQQRAETVMNELVQMGISKSRLAAEGYGPEFPVATNETEAGRAENRRIAVRVTKK